ncbi:DUF4442 domain-containing protein [Mesonia aquimarina]|uniref:DUF4442 domain-containing protein n=1 Tax=Mesonia aquimarina TaxID=1504967 RepID=UPI000EF62095|nr:DUF4442 domain-containing protein [Mesonia aquimarina]
MKFSPSKINTFLLFKLPSAWLCGVRLKRITDYKTLVTVKYRWINQNPFNSMYFAVQAMAAELSTGALVMKTIKNQPQKISMLVASMEGEFLKKAVGKIYFTCEDGILLEETLKNVLKNSEEGQVCKLTSIGKNEAGEIISKFTFNWTLKVKI